MSLIAVLIPLLFMGDIVGPAVPRVCGHAERDNSGVRVRFADADADDVRATAAAAEAGRARACSTMASESAASTRSIAFYGTTLQLGVAAPDGDAVGRRGDAGADVSAVTSFPKGSSRCRIRA